MVWIGSQATGRNRPNDQLVVTELDRLVGFFGRRHGAPRSHL
ncbi:hypothetical protein [Nocardia cyriacigeorgica]|nr:hypothetical protein [Nocardia cyriacigeorgica]